MTNSKTYSLIALDILSLGTAYLSTAKIFSSFQKKIEVNVIFTNYAGSTPENPNAVPKPKTPCDTSMLMLWIPFASTSNYSDITFTGNFYS